MTRQWIAAGLAVAILAGTGAVKMKGAEVAEQAAGAGGASLEIVVSPHVPAAGTACTVMLPGPGTLRIDDGETAWELAGTDALLRWVPEKTGYYTLRWSGDGRSAVRRVPVVWRNFAFFGWNIPPAEEAARYPLLTDCVIVRDKEAMERWRKAGSRVLGFVFQRRRLHLDPNLSPEENTERLTARWRKPLDEGADGIWIDELGAYPDEAGRRAVAIEMAALAAVRKLYPDKILMGCVGGNPLPEYAAGFKAADAVLISETYGEFINLAQGTRNFHAEIDNRVATLRRCDLLFERGYERTAGTSENWRRHGAIVMLSTNHVGGGIREEPAAARLEYDVRHLKKIAPELAGMAFYQGSNEPDYYREVFSYGAQEALLEKYFIRPVVDLRELFFSDYQPRAGKPFRIHLGVYNLGGMRARKVALRLYAVDESGRTFPVAAPVLEELGVGFATLTGPEAGAYAMTEAHGNTYGLLAKRSFVADCARQTLSCDWTPPAAGWYEIVASAEPSEDYTLLDGRIKAQIRVVE